MVHSASLKGGGNSVGMIIKWIITIASAVIIMNIPTTELFTPQLRMYMAITIFFILVMIFEELPNMITAILLPSMYMITGTVSGSVAFGTWTGTSTWMIIGAFVLATCLEVTGLLRRIAYFVIVQFGKSFTGLIIGVFVTGSIVNIIGFGQAYIIVAALTYGIIESLGLKMRSKEAALVAFAGCMAGCDSCLFFYSPAYLGFIETGMKAVDPTYVLDPFVLFKFQGFFVPGFALILWAFCLALKTKDWQVGSAGLDYFKAELAKCGKITADEIKGLIAVIVVLALVLLGAYFGFNQVYGFMVVPYILFIPKIGIKNAAKAVNSVNYPIIFFTVGCMAIGSVGIACGFGKFVQAAAGPLIAGIGTYWVYFILFLFGIAVHLLMSPYGTVSAFAAPVAALAVSVGASPLIAINMLMAAAHVNFFPYQTPVTNVMYAHGDISMKQFMAHWAFKTVGEFIWVMAVLIPVWMILFS